MILKISFVYLLVLLCFTGRIFGSPEISIVPRGREASYPVFGKYFPQEESPSKSVPKYLLESAGRMLEARLERRVFAQTFLVSCCEIDAKKAMDAGFSTPLRYCLKYRILLHHEMAEFYDFILSLDSAGALVVEPDLPSAFLPGGRRLLSKSELIRKSDLPESDWAQAELRFDERRRILTWRISKLRKKWFGPDILAVTLVDAETGKVIDIRQLRPLAEL